MNLKSELEGKERDRERVSYIQKKREREGEKEMKEEKEMEIEIKGKEGEKLYSNCDVQFRNIKKAHLRIKQEVKTFIQ